MKITIVQGPYFPVPPINGGAVEKVWFGLGKEFARRGHEVTHISRLDLRLPQDEVIDGVKHVRIRSVDRPLNQFGINFFDLLYSLRVMRRLPEADILVTNTFWLPILERRPSRGKTYIHVARFPRQQMRAYLGAARLQVVSSVIKDAVIAQTPRAEMITRMIPNALPHDFEVPGRLVTRGDSERFELLYVGRIHPEKGIEILLEAFRRLVSRSRHRMRLRIVGPDALSCGGGGPEYGRQLRAGAADLGDGVEWCSPVFESSKLQEFYAGSDVLVYPSIAAQGEASPLTPVEAMAGGCLPVVSNLKCFADYLKDGVNGFTFELAPDPAANLARLLQRISDTRTSLADMRRKCLETAAGYTLENVANRYVEDFRGLLAATRANA